ncbi:MAG TPA: hypothetical protein VIT83_01910, partial [Gammaproteobacteria bacterium]
RRQSSGIALAGKILVGEKYRRTITICIKEILKKAMQSIVVPPDSEINAVSDKLLLRKSTLGSHRHREQEKL